MASARKTVLSLGKNPREVQRHLRPIIGKKATGKIEEDVLKQVKGLFGLGKQQYRFARRLPIGKDWRQIVSRSYYAAYNVSRAVRLMVHGEYSQDVKDHQRFDQLPGDFPSAATYGNKLGLLRDDRNLCDYDHMARPTDLTISATDAIALVGTFIADSVTYLTGKGVKVK
jgi:hypothetical protein